MTDPREPFETDSPVEGDGTSQLATDLDDARMDERGTADLETGAGETGAAEASSDTADLDTATEVADVTPEIETGDPDSLASDPLAAPAADSDQAAPAPRRHGSAWPPRGPGSSPIGRRGGCAWRPPRRRPRRRR